MATPIQRAQAAQKGGESLFDKAKGAGGKLADYGIFGLGGMLIDGNPVDGAVSAVGGFAGDAAGAIGDGLVKGLKSWFTSDLMKRIGAGLLGILIILLVVVRLSGLGEVAAMAPGAGGAAAKVVA